MNRKEFLFVVIVSFIVVAVWIVSNIYQERSNVAVAPELQGAIQSINPNFDQKTLDKISQEVQSP